MEEQYIGDAPSPEVSPVESVMGYKQREEKASHKS